MVTNNSIDSQNPIEVGKGGTGQSSLTAHSVIVGNTTSGVTQVAVGTTGQVLTGSTGADPAFAALGTNSGLTAHGVLLGENNSAIVATAVGTNGQVLTGSTAADPTWVTPTFTSGQGLTGTFNATTHLYNLDITDMTAKTAPDGEVDYIPIYDNSATNNKKTLLKNCTKFAILTGTRDMSTASGTQSLTGAGFKPKFAFAIWVGTNGGAGQGSIMGAYDGTSNSCMEMSMGSSQVVPQTTFCGIWRTASGSGLFQTFVISSFDSDGCTLTWTKTSTPTGTASFSICLAR